MITHGAAASVITASAMPATTRQIWATRTAPSRSTTPPPSTPENIETANTHDM